ncbi:hypothetical protein ACGFX4_20955 [Kitasatospora sp. NPDC048365]|uniref:hypothetical protein n=1 Tax=Kitasatospora sp. NPDC048365 TaxID=3364050 RepID=UPI003718CD28
MRTPVISRFVATSAAALTLGVALPLLASTPAFACGDAPGASAPAQQPEHHAKDPVASFLPDFPTSITAGGAPVEIGVEQANFTGEPYQHLAPYLGLFASEPSATVPNRLANLEPQHLKVEVMRGGAWQTLKLRVGCDPTISADTSSLAEPLADGRAHRFLFRVTLKASAPAELKQIQVSGGPDALTTIPVARMPKPTTAAPTTPAPKPTTAAPTTPAAVVPAADTTTPAASPTTAAPSTSAPAGLQELASTGPSKATGFLFWSAGAMLVLGGAVLYGVKRIAKR